MQNTPQDIKLHFGGRMGTFQIQNVGVFNKRIKQLISAFAVPMLLATALSACGSNPIISTTQSQNYQFVHTVSLESGDTVALLEEAYGGQVIAWHPEANFAVIGSNQEAVDQAMLDRGRKPIRPPVVSTTKPTTSTYSVQPNTAVVAMAEGQRAAYGSGQRAAYGSGAQANSLIGAMSAWRSFFITGWFGNTTNTPYPTVSANNMIVFTGALSYGGTGGIRLFGAQKLAPNLGRGVKIAVIDTGVDLQHPGLKGVAGDTRQPNHLAPSSDWKDFVDGDSLPQDMPGNTNEGYGHGTGVAGVILQVAPYATIMPIRVLNSDGAGDVTQVTSAIQWAVDHGAKIINLSLGTDTRVDAISQMITWATGKGVYVVAASGNTNDTNVLYPAADAIDATRGGDKLISVGSTGSGNSNLKNAFLGNTLATAAAFDQKSLLSTYGPKVEMVAPGEIITTLLPEEQTGDWTGTSFAAPMVSGTLALALGEPLTATQQALVASAITSSAKNVDACNSSLLGQLGKGRLDTEAFMQKVLGQALSTGTACQ